MLSFGFKRNFGITGLVAATIAMYISACHAAPATDAGTSSTAAAGPVLEFRGTVSGDVLDLNDGKGPDTPAVEKFLRTGKNPYNDNGDMIKSGFTIFSTACSGCGKTGVWLGRLGPFLGPP